MVKPAKLKAKVVRRKKREILPKKVDIRIVWDNNIARIKILPDNTPPHMVHQILDGIQKTLVDMLCKEEIYKEKSPTYIS